MQKIAIIAGDGIGVDVTQEAVKVLRRVNETFRLGLELVEFAFGADYFLKTGVGLPPGQMEEFRNNYAAIYLGALGDPRIPDMRHGREILLAMRFELDLYINLRPVQLLHERLCPLKGKTVKDVNFVVLRENTEGPYVGAGGILKKGTPDEVATQESIHTRKGVERIIRAAFEYARTHGRRRVTMSDKSNVLRYGHDLWQRVFAEVGAEYPDIEQDHYFVDALVMKMVKSPEAFQVIVTENMLGDIITDLGAMLQGGLGMAGSANIHPGRVSLFEPVHGSAPYLAGQNKANPIAAITTVAMMLDYLGHAAAAAAVQRAVQRAVEENQVTADIGGRLGTRECGDFIAAQL
ncbi:MAG: 3-isopropylmalate dehydrogenase [candidate division KSB1 bacterium]|nr:3-isopropylmalate dehydrogenase [candidate division KSB1 bacterium]MDZ7275345.1 3-isopropylmalate dehydrogenase [candidate division KSB1 bacterium]MDZ7287512.1 3-isopropylmalate dehydrogenase [candidate division KSB1 bacterium]MDZ7299626.1 3-isopropylmalate dehydrogenase [candidate division KSB1 bacterium]MDZ7307419.1 3-isopropylmalate dehydrogenase [candidate division KSB1 bacterium]